MKRPVGKNDGQKPDMPKTGDIPLTDHHWRVTLPMKPVAARKLDLHRAVVAGDMWRFGILMQPGMIMDVDDDVLSCAIECGRTDMFAILAAQYGLGNRAEINEYLEVAIREEKLDIAKILVEKYRADVNDEEGYLLWVAANADSVKAVRFLLEHGLDIAKEDGSAYERAAMNGRPDVMAELIRHHRPRPRTERRALEAAVRASQDKAVVFLLSRGVTLDGGVVGTLSKTGAAGLHRSTLYLADKMKNNKTALHQALLQAIRRGNENMVKALIEKGADPARHHSESVFTALKEDDVEMIGLLLDRGASVNAVWKNESLLMQAARRSTPAVVAYLLDRGADDSFMNYAACRLAEVSGKAANAALLQVRRDRFLATQATACAARFKRLFGAHYTMDDLRRYRGRKGENGLDLAAMAQDFARLAGGATDAADPVTGLCVADLYTPEDRTECLVTHLYKTRKLPDLFDRAFWRARPESMLEAYESLPEGWRKGINVGPLYSALKRERIMQQAPKRRPFR